MEYTPEPRVDRAAAPACYASHFGTPTGNGASAAT